MGGHGHKIISYFVIHLIGLTYLSLLPTVFSTYPDAKQGDSCSNDFDCVRPAPAKGTSLKEAHLVCDTKIKTNPTCQCYTLDPEKLGPNEGHWNWTWVPDQSICLPDVGAPCVPSKKYLPFMCASGICKNFRCAALHGGTLVLLQPFILIITLLSSYMVVL